ncbi:MAG: 3-hydroxyacyl-CoA dehydrogenase NAD-binding domain-containing protein [Bacteroidia bacterium]|nr:3-hydroxyacyl-CoA dehydrogenase NAD-binding domain-containing protein [Bacteroidia bacterium]MDW8014687.1 3-hydroxyacyl-CoA dehydrogenase NAD-binding domain-containing protein [Bacteroidia bacterium]
MDVLILGAGTMGRGIAEVFASKGFPTWVYEPHSHAYEKAQKLLSSKGEQIHLLDTLPSFISHEVVIEAIPEELELKKQAFIELESRLSPSTVVATNTSSLSVHALAHDLGYKERFLGWHFFNPPTRMPLVEVIPTTFTAGEVVRKSMEILRLVGKTPLLAPDLPGFIVNRIARPYYIEALRLAERGEASPEVIDQLLEGIGFRMGPFRLMDFIGIDVNHAVTCKVWEGLWHPPRFRPSWLQAQKVAAGHTGRKAGQGFYDYKKE